MSPHMPTPRRRVYVSVDGISHVWPQRAAVLQWHTNVSFEHLGLQNRPLSRRCYPPDLNSVPSYMHGDNSSVDTVSVDVARVDSPCWTLTARASSSVYWQNPVLMYHARLLRWALQFSAVQGIQLASQHNVITPRAYIVTIEKEHYVGRMEKKVQGRRERWIHVRRWLESVRGDIKGK